MLPDIGGLDLARFLASVGAPGVMALVLVALMRGWLVVGHVHRDVLLERDDWREIAMSSARGAEKAIELSRLRRRDRREPAS